MPRRSPASASDGYGNRSVPKRQAGYTASGARRADRAAQFMPFAALSGYYDFVRREEHVTEPRHELTEEEAEALSRALLGLRRGDAIQLVYYHAGRYLVREGTVTGIDMVYRSLGLDGERISFEAIRSIRQEGEQAIR